MPSAINTGQYARLIECDVDPELAANYLAEIMMCTDRVAQDAPDTVDGVAKLFEYRVPRLSPDGSCSLEEPAPEPFDLRPFEGVEGLPYKDLIGHIATTRLYALTIFTRWLHRKTEADWTGVYRKHEGTPPALVKKAYEGRPSRALFPLTEEFARKSNNSTVGLRGKTVLVKSVATHVGEGNPYYACDAEVKSELCLPVVRQTADGVEIASIIDIESFNEAHFNEDRRSAAVAASYWLALNPHLL